MLQQLFCHHFTLSLLILWVMALLLPDSELSPQKFVCPGGLHAPPVVADRILLYMSGCKAGIIFEKEKKKLFS